MGGETQSFSNLNPPSNKIGLALDLNDSQSQPNTPAMSLSGFVGVDGVDTFDTLQALIDAQQSSLEPTTSDTDIAFWTATGGGSLADEIARSQNYASPYNNYPTFVTQPQNDDPVMSYNIPSVRDNNDPTYPGRTRSPSPIFVSDTPSDCVTTLRLTKNSKLLREYVFYVSPDTIEISVPSRVNVYQSIGGGTYVDHLGTGVTSITLGGHTGFIRKGKRRILGFGYLQYLALKNLINLYNDECAMGNGHTLTLDLNLSFPDAPAYGQWEVTIKELGLRRSTGSDSLLFRYQLQLLCLSDNKVNVARPVVAVTRALPQFDPLQFESHGVQIPVGEDGGGTSGGSGNGAGAGSGAASGAPPAGSPPADAPPVRTATTAAAKSNAGKSLGAGATYQYTVPTALPDYMIKNIDTPTGMRSNAQLRLVKPNSSSSVKFLGIDAIGQIPEYVSRAASLMGLDTRRFKGYIPAGSTSLYVTELNKDDFGITDPKLLSSADDFTGGTYNLNEPFLIDDDNGTEVEFTLANTPSSANGNTRLYKLDTMLEGSLKINAKSTGFASNVGTPEVPTEFKISKGNIPNVIPFTASFKQPKDASCAIIYVVYWSNSPKFFPTDFKLHVMSNLTQPINASSTAQFSQFLADGPSQQYRQPYLGHYYSGSGGPRIVDGNEDLPSFINYFIPDLDNITNDNGDLIVRIKMNTPYTKTNYTPDKFYRHGCTMFCAWYSGVDVTRTKTGNSLSLYNGRGVVSTNQIKTTTNQYINISYDSSVLPTDNTITSGSLLAIATWGDFIGINETKVDTNSQSGGSSTDASIFGYSFTSAIFDSTSSAPKVLFSAQNREFNLNNTTSTGVITKEDAKAGGTKIDSKALIFMMKEVVNTSSAKNNASFYVRGSVSAKYSDGWFLKNESKQYAEIVSSQMCLYSLPGSSPSAVPLDSSVYNLSSFTNTGWLLDAPRSLAEIIEYIYRVPYWAGSDNDEWTLIATTLQTLNGITSVPSKILDPGTQLILPRTVGTKTYSFATETAATVLASNNWLSVKDNLNFSATMAPIPGET